MTQAEEISLLGGMPLVAAGLHIRQIKLDELRRLDSGGVEKYHQLLSVISMGHGEILKCLQIEEKYFQLSEEERAPFTSYRLLTEVETLRQCLSEALSFFIVEPLEWEEHRKVFSVRGVRGQGGPSVSDQSYAEIRRSIMLSNCLTVDDLELQKFKGKRGRAIYERILAGRESARKAKQAASDEPLALPCIISAVSTRHNSLNLLNIWDMTIYQLYDQFTQLNKSFQVDVSSLKWAAWGTEQFDFSLWYKSVKNT